MENILLETMYQLPSLKSVSKVVVDESVVMGHAPPYVVYKTEAEKAEEPRRASGISR
jgi:ATP-dependent Clp protease ATP-binding subunit ClpX